MSPEQMMEEPQKRKKKEASKLEFDAGKVFDVQPAEDLKVDEEMFQYHAVKGQGGDRRA
mgnify:CR=1 FL=1